MNLLEYQVAASRTSSANGIVLVLAEGQDSFPIVSVGDVPSRAAWRVANGATGLGAEGGELIGVLLTNYTEILWMSSDFKDKVKKELGDILWYLAETASGLGVNLGLVNPHSNEVFLRVSTTANLLQVAKEAGECADYLKKLLWHGKKVDWAVVHQHFGRVLAAVQIAAEMLELTVEETCEANINKLLIRYPNGLSAEASEARVDLLPETP